MHNLKAENRAETLSKTEIPIKHKIWFLQMRSIESYYNNGFQPVEQNQKIKREP